MGWKDTSRYIFPADLIVRLELPANGFLFTAILNLVDPTFSQPERRNLFLPIALAALVLAAVIFLLLRYTPHRTADLTITHTAAWQTRTTFKSDTILVGRDKTQDDLYVLTTLRIDDKLRLPLFLKDFTATLITANGETMATSAAEKTDLVPLYTTYPALKALSSTPLLREADIQPGQSVQGMVLLHFPITQDEWDHRQSATLTVDLYHQASQTILIPKN